MNTQEIPYGYCHCGCGQKTTIPTKTDRSNGRIKGKPMKFVNSHNIAPFHSTIAEALRFYCEEKSPNDCWEWKGFRHPKGYGVLRYHYQGYMAHRVAYELKHGPVPKGLQVLHKCDNPPCCNPDHLFTGSIADNIKDKTEKGRQAKGESIGISKLKREQVIEMRKLHSNGITQKELSKQFNVSQSQVNKIINNKVWKHIL